MGAALLFFILLILIAMIVYFTLDPAPLSPYVAFLLVLNTVMNLSPLMIGMSGLNKLLQKKLSEARALTSVAVTPSNVTHDNDNDNDNDNDGNQGGSDSKNCVPIPCYAETTTATTSSTATTATAATTAASRTTKRPMGLIALFIGRPSSDRDYAALPADNSVHDSHDMVTGVPISAQQKL